MTLKPIAAISLSSVKMKSTYVLVLLGFALAALASPVKGKSTVLALVQQLLI
jgi:hypothetical protein